MKCYNHAERDAIGICSDCGRGVCEECAVETEDSIYCKKCISEEMKSSKSTPSPPPPPSQPSATTRQPSYNPPSIEDDWREDEDTSAAWWLLPIILGWLGGLIGYFALKNKDKGKAKKVGILGVVLSIIYIIIILAIGAPM